MRLGVFVIAAAAAAGLSGTAMAQEGSAQPATQPVVPVVVQTTGPANTSYGSNTGDHWVASAFVGTNFGSGRNNDLIDTNGGSTSINFGGQAAYLWGGYVGAEALVDFAPSFELGNVLFEKNPLVNSYMANGIVAAPFGSNNQYLPYVSGGLGAIQLRSTILCPISTLSAPSARMERDSAGTLAAASWGSRESGASVVTCVTSRPQSTTTWT